MLEFPTSDPILAKQVTSKDFDGDIFELGLYVDVDSYRDKPFQKTIRYHLNLDDDYNLKKFTKTKTKFLVWGQEGTGKTTELKYLAHRLKGENNYCLLFFEYPSELIEYKLEEPLEELKLAFLISLLIKIHEEKSYFLSVHEIEHRFELERKSWEVILRKIQSKIFDLEFLENLKKLLNYVHINKIIDRIVNELKDLYLDCELLFVLDGLQLENIDDEDIQDFINSFGENLIISTNTYVAPNDSMIISNFQFSSFKNKESVSLIIEKRVEKTVYKSLESLVLEGGNIGLSLRFLNTMLLESLGNTLESGHLKVLFNNQKLSDNQIIKLQSQIKRNVKRPNFLNTAKAREYFQNQNLLFFNRYNFIINPIFNFILNETPEDRRLLKVEYEGVTLSLCKIYIKDFRGIKELIIDDIVPKSNFIFILGENGFGKTSILQSIALGFLGDTDRNKIMIDENERRTAIIELVCFDAEDAFITSYRDGVRPIRYFTSIFCYGSSRLSIQNSQSKNEVTEKSSNMYGLFYDDNNMLDIEYELSSKWDETDNRFLQTQSLFKRLIPNLKEIKVNENKDIEYFEIDSSQPLKFNQLSAASKAHIALFGDLIIKFLKQYPETTNFADFEGIVIIDELELHLHPKWQRELPTLLAEIFPKVQFIVSTHSVFPILGAPKASVFIKVYRNDERGVWAEKIDIDPTNLTPNILFTSPLFDMDSILSVNNTDITEVRLEENNEEMEFADEVKAKLKAITGKDVPSNILKLPN